MKHSFSHDLDHGLAKRAVAIALDSYAEKFAQYDPQVSWRTDAHARIGFRVKGVSLDGSVDVAARQIHIDLKVPFVLRVFKGKAIEVIEREIKKWLEKAKSGELDS